MASIIANLLTKIGGKKERRVLMVGLDAAGKTTILYKLKLGEVVTTIPTIGFNVESVEYKSVSFTIWDVGGRDKIRPLWRHYYQNTQAVIMVIDSNDRERLCVKGDAYDIYSTAEGSMYQMLEEDELKSAPLFIFANKQDLPNAMSVKEITEKLQLNERIKDRPWHIQGGCATTGEGVYEMMEVMRETLLNYTFDEKAWELKIANKKKIILLICGYIREAVNTLYITKNIPSEITKLIHIFQQDPNEMYDEYIYYGDLVENVDIDADHLKKGKTEILIEFLEQKESFKHYIADEDAFIDWYEKRKDFIYDNKWEHYDFIRMIWILFKKHERQEGLKLIWKLSAHNVTNTYFWSQLVYFGMHCNEDNNLSKYVRTNFEYFLILNPCLSNNYKDLMKKYYSEKLLKEVENERKDEMVLPDIMALPSLVTDIEKLKKQKNVNVETVEFKSNDDDDDAVFISNFETRSFKSWEGHQSFLRVVWCYTDQFNGTQEAVKKIMSEWKTFKGESYHETKCYFWIHMIRYWRILYKEYFNGSNAKGTDAEWNFKGFLNFCGMKKKKGLKCKILSEQWWSEYYSDNVINNRGFNNMDASIHMVLPDIKQLPQLQLVSKQKR